MNDIVMLDMKEYKKHDIYFLHMIDLATFILCNELNYLLISSLKILHYLIKFQRS